MMGCAAPPKPFGAYANPIMPTVYNVTLTDNSTEYSQLLPDGTRELYFQCRDGTAFRYAFVTGKVAGSTEPYMTCLSNGSANYTALTDNLTLYLAGETSGKVIEIICWE
jgi:hypothetical protein